jgi:hypothetical protein
VLLAQVARPLVRGLFTIVVDTALATSVCPAEAVRHSHLRALDIAALGATAMSPTETAGLSLLVATVLLARHRATCKHPAHHQLVRLSPDNITTDQCLPPTVSPTQSLVLGTLAANFLRALFATLQGCSTIIACELLIFTTAHEQQ